MRKYIIKEVCDLANKYGGGTNTNKHGLQFEQDTSLYDAIKNAGLKTEQVSEDEAPLTHKVFQNNEFIGYITGKKQLYKHFLNPRGVNQKEIHTKEMQPDDVFINIKEQIAYIFEKKFQNTAGSTDEKLHGCDFNKRQFQKLFEPIGYKVEYIYILNDWFKQPVYGDSLQYMTDTGCKYYFNELPLDVIGL